MAETVYRGPAVSIGPLMGTVIPQGASGFIVPGAAGPALSGTQPALLEPTDGPGIDYQATTFPDVRFGPFNKDGLKPGRIPTFLNSPYVVSVDVIPSTAGTATIAALANVTSGTAMTLVTVAPGGSSGVPSLSPATPIIPLGGTTNQSFPPSGTVTNVLALDFGFSTGTTTAGNVTVASVPDSTFFYTGQWIVIGGAGNSGNTAPLITQVQTIPSATAITVSPAPTGSLTAAPIGSANLYQPAPAGFFPFTGAFSGGATGFTAAPNATQPYWTAGVAAAFNPLEALTRGVSITGVASGTGGVMAVSGFDIYGAAMHENITVGAGVNTVFGQKAFKYINTVVPQFTDAHNYSVGISDTFGINVRSDKWEYSEFFWAGAFNTVNTGWTAAVTSTATAVTGDVRGTIQVSSLGRGTGYAPTLTSNGSRRLTIFSNIPLYNLIYSTPSNPVPMFGVTQF